MKYTSKLNDKKILALYFIVTFIFSWSFWLVSGVLIRDDVNIKLDNHWLLSQVGVFGPSLIAIIFTYFCNQKQNLNNLIKLSAIYFTATMLGIMIVRQDLSRIEQLNQFTAIGIIICLGVIVYYLGMSPHILNCRQERIHSIMRFVSWAIFSILFFPILFILAWTLVNIQTNTPFKTQIGGTEGAIIVHLLILFSFDIIFGGAFGEEIGWRGFVLPILLNRYSPLKSGLILGIFWSLWHLPIDLFQGFGVAGISGILMRLLLVCPMSIIITWFYIHTQKPILSALLLHASLNILPIIKFTNYELSMAVMIIEMITICIFIIAIDKKFMTIPQFLQRNND